MSDRSLLGAADVPDEVLTAMVAEQLGAPAEQVELRAVEVDVAPYDIEALTTAGRYRLQGRAGTGAGERPFSFFVKVVQSWARSPVFAVLPPEVRELALQSLPWQVEPEVYRSDLGRRLPAGLVMPRVYAVRDLDRESAALWLQDVDVVEGRWSVDGTARAARLLGRLAASPSVAPTAGLGRTVRDLVRSYAEGRVAHQVVPALHDDALWRHPLLTVAFGAQLRADLVEAAARLPQVVEELEEAPHGTAHGDACTRNLLVQRGSDDVVLIDYGMWGRMPLGFDLGQLLLGEVQLGERDAADLPALEQACLPAYVEGLRLEGCDVPATVVQRSHALLALLFFALSSVPFEHLGGPPTPAVQRVACERAAAARWVLDLVGATAQ